MDHGIRTNPGGTINIVGTDIGRMGAISSGIVHKNTRNGLSIFACSFLHALSNCPCFFPHADLVS